MGGHNKLLMPMGDRPMVCHVAAVLQDAGVDDVIVVTGHQCRNVESVLSNSDVGFIHNPDFDQGISSSLITGIKALGDAQAVLVCLGDMPEVTSTDIASLISSFDPDRGRAICVPTFRGTRGNPILWPRRLFKHMMRLRGDIGAKRLLSAFSDLVHEVPMRGPGVLIDYDTPQALASYHRRSAGVASV